MCAKNNSCRSLSKVLWYLIVQKGGYCLSYLQIKVIGHSDTLIHRRDKLGLQQNEQLAAGFNQ